MLDMLKRTIYASIGLAVLTREKAEELGKKIVQDAQMSESEGREFIDELMKKSDEVKASIEKMVNEKVEYGLKKLNIPTRKEYDELVCRIKKLEEQSSTQDLR